MVVFYLAKILIWKQFTTVVGQQARKFRCLLSCKDTNLKAIHNQVMCVMEIGCVVFYLAKILIWKQFTTELEKSQKFCGCLLSCKDTNLKAIHNGAKFVRVEDGVVFYLAKILIWKQFTTQTVQETTGERVVFYLAKILIWKQFTTVTVIIYQYVLLSSILQRY